MWRIAADYRVPASGSLALDKTAILLAGGSIPPAEVQSLKKPPPEGDGYEFK